MMLLGEKIHRIRTAAQLTQTQFSDIFGVSQQSVQKWESGQATPDLDKIVLISKYFDVSLDALILGNDNRVVEEMKQTKALKPQYQNMHDWEFYSSNLLTEYQQSLEEGLDVEKYKDVFSSVSRLPKGEIKKKLGDVLFEIVTSTGQREGYPYVEPSEPERIQSLRKKTDCLSEYSLDALEDKLHGAWMGRVCGCMLGKTVEGIRTNELIPFLKETGNYPMHRYIYRSDLTDEIIEKYKFGFSGRCYADKIDGMPVDDDTNYVVLAQRIIEKYGRDFTPYDVSKAWVRYQSKDAYCTAERVAFCNFVKGYTPPESAVYKNPYREWIGAQIRGDYFGYINPGNPELAAEMAWRDASISHVKNGIYGEMFVAAMLAVAATTNDLEKILLGGLAEIPYTSRLYEGVTTICHAFQNGVSQKDCFAMIHSKWDEHSEHDWCHTISNAMIVAASLLYGRGDFGKSICMAVEAGFDTDCNGATVGSVLGMANGIESISEYWREPINNTLHTSIFGVGTVKISDCVKLTMEHITKA
ncbi:MAG: ADP-ribosylglycohydrolase family protein [Clostridia bacterium]|nr:ADP-ribosylglycohydrolase family protein [Clostridia bacterium]